MFFEVGILIFFGFCVEFLNIESEKINDVFDCDCVCQWMNEWDTNDYMHIYIHTQWDVIEGSINQSSSFVIFGLYSFFFAFPLKSFFHLSLSYCLDICAVHLFVLSPKKSNQPNKNANFHFNFILMFLEMLFPLSKFILVCFCSYSNNPQIVHSIYLFLLFLFLAFFGFLCIVPKTHKALQELSLLSKSKIC